MGYKKVGVATCIGLLNECNAFAKVARAKGIEVYGVACKVGSHDKTEIGIPEEGKLQPGKFEAFCNHVLRDISVTVGTGETVTIIGASGSGKSTFLRTLNYLETPDTGVLYIGQDQEHLSVYDGSRLHSKSAVELRRHTAMVFQSFNLFRNKTALGNVTEALTVVRKMKKDDAEALAARCLQQVGMGDRMNYYPPA